VPGRTLLVASTGGHLEELFRLRGRLSPGADSVGWATFDDHQSRSLLAQQEVHTVPYIAPRDVGAAARGLPRALAILRRGRFDRVVSTGSGIALPFLTAAWILGLESHYVESAARTSGPSLSGSLVSRLPGSRTYTQYQAWSSSRWVYRGSLFDGYTVSESGGTQPPAHRVVVTLGTMRTYGFRRAVEKLAQLLPQVTAADADVLWQVGSTDISGLPVDGRQYVPAEEIRAAVQAADLVVAHAGIGSALSALDAGRSPVLLPRSHRHGEHVDDHQKQIASALSDRRLVVSRDPAVLTVDDLLLAMRRRVLPAESAEPFHLG
jgi:UDP-N-acetylglucosamine--N-acetylmuramyl-(pentapeptide) pyrophosphoryl-undecaprenol N-acetylglucosamine transferase